MHKSGGGVWVFSRCSSDSSSLLWMSCWSEAKLLIRKGTLWSFFTFWSRKKLSHFFFLKERWELMRPGQRDPDLSVQRIGLQNAANFLVRDQIRPEDLRNVLVLDMIMRTCAETHPCDTQVTLTGRKRMQLWGKYFHVLVNATSAGQNRTQVSLLPFCGSLMS